MAITEGRKFPPGSGFINVPPGELCGSVFWVFLNQRLHCLEPDREEYTAQIERVLFNPLPANQVGSSGIRCHALLHGRKSPGTAINTCCEVRLPPGWRSPAAGLRVVLINLGN
jgi:hypothetical protein